MNLDSIIIGLENEWEKPDGFLGGLRDGRFSIEGANRLVQLLDSADIGDSSTINRRFVSLTWYIPMFMTWQMERIQRDGGNTEELELITNKILNKLENILGYP